jgi:cell division GTPase FtsZ
LNKKAKLERRVQIVANSYAINNDQNALTQLKARYRELQTVFVNHILEDQSARAGADVMRVEGGRVLTAIKPGDFYDTDAILLIAGSAGNFGSGGVPVMAQQLKDRHVGKPIYALIALPFATEADEPKFIYNTAICLKSIQKVTDAVFLVDNNKFKAGGSSSSSGDMDEMNKQIVFPFYDLLCANERIDPKYMGARTLGVGDMMQTLKGWTAIGMGATDFQVARSFWKSTPTFLAKGSETQKAMEAMNLALGRLSIDFNLEDGRRAIYLLAIPAEGANVDMVKTLGNRLLELTNNALIRGGDFHGVRNCAQVTLVISDLSYLDIVKSYYDRATSSTRTETSPTRTTTSPKKKKK